MYPATAPFPRFLAAVNAADWLAAAELLDSQARLAWTDGRQRMRKKVRGRAAVLAEWQQLCASYTAWDWKLAYVPPAAPDPLPPGTTRPGLELYATLAARAAPNLLPGDRVRLATTALVLETEVALLSCTLSPLERLWASRPAPARQAAPPPAVAWPDDEPEIGGS